MQELVSDVLEALDPLAKEKGVTMKFQQPDSMFVIQCDKDMIKQVLYNLVANALKFVPDQGGEIDLKMRMDYDELQVWVADNGKGIPAELHELIFDKFFQARNQTLQKPVGSGLGLAICQKIIGLHNGRIWVEHNEPAGARFMFTLPGGLDVPFA
ncbi:ATPase/histidine kinase/DNA gyrase B/HSP90 domain protein [Ostertagia ostertagi]